MTSSRLMGMKRLLVLMMLLASASVGADAGSYRVEVIVFRNLDVLVDSQFSEELRSFSQFPALEESDLPDDLIPLDKKSDYMDAVWRRLRSSKGYRPLLFSSWEQNRTDYYPPMRIHDDMLLDEGLNPPTQYMIADLVSEDPLADYVSSYYRLDGTVQLKRSRFLHLFVDLEYRNENPGLINEVTYTDTEERMFPPTTPTGHKLHALQQNRQIRTGRVQYFDTPYFGVLVLVTALSAK